MNMKRIIVVTGTLAMAVALGGCGHGNQNTTASAIPGSAASVSGTDVFAADVSSPAIGHLVGDMEPGRGLVSNGKAGYLMYGQYFKLDAGHYRVTVRGTIQDTSGDAATFDVVYDKASQTAVKKQVTTEENAASSIITSLEFKLSQTTGGIEVRALVPQDVQMTISGYTVTRLP